MSNDMLWAPWRMDYIRSLSPTPGPGSAPPSPGQDSSCFLCDAAAVANAHDARRLLRLHQDQRGLILLNRYPYTNGHLLVAIPDHRGDLTDLTPAQRAGLMELVAMAETLLRTAINPQGVNIGMNIGRCAGAGLPGHLHVHVVPRWHGDVNFMQAVGQVRVIPQALEESYNHLSQALAQGLPR